jgi:hypothetical protein
MLEVSFQKSPLNIKIKNLEEKTLCDGDDDDDDDSNNIVLDNSVITGNTGLYFTQICPD